MSTVSDFADTSPYIGLRTFREADSRFFCGRKSHVAEVLQRLGTRHFVAVVGLSGSGKSSLVRAGVIPELHADRLEDSSSHWIIATATPETAPVSRMAAALKTAVAEYWRENELLPEDLDPWMRDVDDVISEGNLGLCDAIESLRDTGLPENTCVLLVVDQFEELFRYRQRADLDEGESFIRQLLTAVAGGDGLTPGQPALPGNSRVYVVITMRSEFLGECARYPGLAEVVNAGLYLTPRLDREQLKEAISVPARKCGREIDPALVRRLVNEIVYEQDQLPVLQHALMQCWKRNKPLNEALFDEIGGTDALNKHAESLLRKLREEDSVKAVILERLFKRITKPGNQDGAGTPGKDGLREPARLKVICTEIGFRAEKVTEVIEGYRAEGRAFLRPEWPETIDEESTIDITHESLIRKWTTLQRWVVEEAGARDAYFRLLDDVRAGYTLSRNAAEAYQTMRQSGQWRPEWALRYGGNYAAAIVHLDTSLATHKAEAEAQVRAIGEQAAREKAEAQRLAELAEERRRAEVAQAELRVQVAEAQSEAETQKAEKERVQAQKLAELAEERRKVEVAEAELQTQVFRREKDEAERKEAAAREAAENEARLHRLQLEAIETARRKRVRNFQIICVAASLVILLILGMELHTITARTSTTNETILLSKLIQAATKKGDKMGTRVSAAVGASLLGGILRRQDYPEESISVNDWELFSAIDNSPDRSATGATQQPVVRAGGVSISVAGDLGAVAGPKGIGLWSLAVPPVLLKTFLLPNAAKVRFSRTGKSLVAASDSGVEVIGIATGKKAHYDIDSTIIPPDVGVAAVFFIGESDSEIGVLSYHGNLIFYPSGTHQTLTSEALTALAISNDQEYLLWSDPQSSHVVDVKTPLKSSDLGKGLYLTAAAFSPDSRCVAVGVGDRSGTHLEQVAALANPATPKKANDCGASLPYTIGTSVRSVAVGLAPDGKTYQVAAGTEQMAYVFGSSAGPKPLTFAHEDAVNYVAFGEDGYSLITASSDHNARVFDIRTQLEKARIAHQSPVIFASLAAGATKLVFSVSGDGVSLVTNTADSADSMVRQQWHDSIGKDVPPGGCEPTQSAITAHVWAWDCAPDVYISRTTPSGKPNLEPVLHSNTPASSVRGMAVSADENTLAIVANDRCENAKQKGLIRVSSLLTSSDAGLPLSKCLNSELVPWANPLLSVSANGQEVAVAYSTFNDQNVSVWRVRVFHRESDELKEIPEQQKPFSDVVQIVGLAVSNKGAVAVATARFKKTSQLFVCDPTCNYDSESAVTITSLAFLEDSTQPNDPKVVYGESDDLLWVQRLSQKSRFNPGTAINAGKDIVKSIRIFPNKDGSRFAAVAGSVATFFPTTEPSAEAPSGLLNSLRQLFGIAAISEERSAKKTLVEPGEIQGLAFVDNTENVMTSVLVKPDPSVKGTLAMFTHHLSELEHATWICDHQADNPSMQTYFASRWTNEHLNEAAPDVCPKSQKK